MIPLLEIKFNFNTDLLLQELDNNIDLIVEHPTIPIEAKEDFKDFKILKESDNVKLPILNEECERFKDWYKLSGDLDIRPRYYVCETDGKFPMHKDMDTTAAVNHLMTTPVPIIINDKPYRYNTAVIDTQQMHGVDNTGHNRRKLVKLSFFDITYEDLVRKITIVDAGW